MEVNLSELCINQSLCTHCTMYYCVKLGFVSLKVYCVVKCCDLWLNVVIFVDLFFDKSLPIIGPIYTPIAYRTPIAISNHQQKGSSNVHAYILYTVDTCFIS